MFWLKHFAQRKNSQTPLDKANATIRAANRRINELKENMLMLEIILEHYITENESLKSQASELKSQASNLTKEIEHCKTLLGIQNLSPYEIMGVKRQPDFSLLREQYKKLSAIYHPDKGGSTEMMKIINMAYSKIKSK